MSSQSQSASIRRPVIEELARQLESAGLNPSDSLTENVRLAGKSVVEFEERYRQAEQRARKIKSLLDTHAGRYATSAQLAELSGKIAPWLSRPLLRDVARDQKTNMPVSVPMGMTEGLSQAVARSSAARGPMPIIEELCINPEAEEYQTRAAHEAQDWLGHRLREEADMHSKSGVVGTPFSGSIPLVEQSSDLYPFRARGLSTDLGVLSQQFRQDAIIQEGITTQAGLLAPATWEFALPDVDPRLIEMTGTSVDGLKRLCDELNAEWLLNPQIDGARVRMEMPQVAMWAGFSLYEFWFNPDAWAPVGRRFDGFEPRMPNTVNRWITDRNGSLVAVQQTNPNFGGPIVPVIDVRKLVHCVYGRDGENWEGLAKQRPCRAEDELAVAFISSAMLHRMRFGAGVPIMKRTESAQGLGSADGAAVTFKAWAQYTNLVDAAMELGPGYDLDILTVEAEKGLVEVIELCNNNKRAALGTTLLGMGTGQAPGAYNLGDVKSLLLQRMAQANINPITSAMRSFAAAYISMYWPGSLSVLPVMRIKNVFTRAPSERLAVQASFQALDPSIRYSVEDLKEIALQNDITWSDPKAPDTDQPEQPVDLAADTLPGTGEDGHVAPAAAQKASAKGWNARAHAEPADRYTPLNHDARIISRIRGGKPLSVSDLRMLEAWFDDYPDPTVVPGWEGAGPFWQEYQSKGGAPMAKWLGVVLADSDGVPVQSDEPKQVTTEPTYLESPATAVATEDDAGTPLVQEQIAEPAAEPESTGAEVNEAQTVESRKLEGFGRDRCGCEVCDPFESGIEARAAGRSWKTVRTRTGEFLTFRALTETEQSVAFEQIAQQKTDAIATMKRELEKVQKQHRTAFNVQVQLLIERRDVVAIGRMSLDYMRQYRDAILPTLRRLSAWSRSDALMEVASQLNMPSWQPTRQPTSTMPEQAVIAAAEQMAMTMSERTNEQLRGAALQVANGAPSRTLTMLPLAVSTTATNQLEQVASTTVNATREKVAAEESPEIDEAIYSAVMDRWTCPACEALDGRRFKYGSPEYYRNAPPNPKCRSVANSGGRSNMCQCMYVYTYKRVDPSGVSTPNGALVLDARSVVEPVTFHLAVGLPGTGKSTWAQRQLGMTIIDRDDFVLTEDGGYESAGIEESFDAVRQAVEAGATDVAYVACTLSPQARMKLIERLIRCAGNRPAEFVAHVFDASAEEVHRVNESRAETRGSIPPEQLSHFIDAWSVPTLDEPFTAIVRER